MSFVVTNGELETVLTPKCNKKKSWKQEATFKKHVSYLVFIVMYIWEWNHNLKKKKKKLPQTAPNFSIKSSKSFYQKGNNQQKKGKANAFFF